MRHLMFDEFPWVVEIIDFDSVRPACQIPMHKSLNDALSNPEACNIAIIRSYALDRSVSNAT